MDDDVALCEEARKIGREFVVKIEGLVRERSNKNPNRATGDIELEVKSLEILNASKTPPFTIEEDTDGGEDENDMDNCLPHHTCFRVSG